MIQADLLADLPRARSSDPVTSHLAAARIKRVLGDQQHCVLRLVQDFPGHTSAELAQKHVGAEWALARPMVARRLPELEPVYVRKGEARVCNVTGNPSVTWWPR